MNQKLSDLVKTQKFVVWSKDEAVDIVMSNAEPGTSFRLSYCPKDENPYKYVGLSKNGFVDCDSFLLDDGSLDFDKLKKKVVDELSKEFDFEHGFYSDEKAQQMYDDLKKLANKDDEPEKTDDEDGLILF